MRNPNRGEIWFCAIRLPNLGAASLDAAASLNTAAYLGATANSLDTTSLDVAP
jgi:hypothetical protein